MGHILSQQEIDALLSALPAEQSSVTPAGQPEKVVKPYDFMRPDRFNKEQIRTLELMHENFSRRVSSVLSAYLRTVLQVNLVSVEQEIYDEYTQQLPQPSVLAVVSMEPLEGLTLFELNMQTTFSIIDRLLGGSGRPAEQRNALTEIEESLIDGILSLVLQEFAQAWSQVGTIVPKLEDIAYSPQFLQVATPTEVVLAVRFELRLGDFSGSMSICIPYPVMEPVVPKLTARQWIASGRKNQGASIVAIRSQLDRVKIPISVILGEASITVEDLINLQIGDVITLDRRTGQDIEVLAGSERKFAARPGTVGRRNGVIITSVIQEPTLEPSASEEEEEGDYVS